VDATDRNRTMVRDAMIHAPQTCGPQTTVAEAAGMFEDDHIHVLLIVEDGRLLAVIERDDLAAAPAGSRAQPFGRLHNRVVKPDVDLEVARLILARSGGRRLAVVADDGRLLGLLCLKRTRLGFCSDADVRIRAVARQQRRSGS
jgi:CBS domain-containing protein